MLMIKFYYYFLRLTAQTLQAKILEKFRVVGVAFIHYYYRYY